MMKDQDKIALLLKEAKKVRLVDLIENLNELLEVQGFLIQTVYELKPKLKQGEAYIETLITKMIFTSKSVLCLIKGQDLEIYNSPNKIEILDTPSIFILTRSIIEIFLTLEYLYFDSKNSSENDFKFKLWRVSGFMSRQAFSSSISNEFIEKLKKEELLIENIKNEIKLSPHYSKLKKQDLWKLDTFGLPRLNSWGNLIKNSRLKSDIFEKGYGLYSNYAHSEYISMMQMNEGNLNKNDPNNISSAETALIFIQMINSVTILLLLERFKELEKNYEEINDEIRVRIELWSRIALK